MAVRLIVHTLPCVHNTRKEHCNIKKYTARQRAVHVSASGTRIESPTYQNTQPPAIATLQRAIVQRARDGETIPLATLWQGDRRVLLVFFTHFGDLSSFEFAQKLLPRLAQLEAAGVQVISIGLGEPEKARKFSGMLGFPVDKLYADANGTTYRDLGFNQGFLPDSNINPYAKLLPMLMGIGSQGTIQEVLRGYIGDSNSLPVFSGSNPFDVLGKGYQRPFELATLRLYNMNAVLSNWSELAPDEGSLLTLQGGCMLIQDDTILYQHKDTGILRYANVDAVVAASLEGLTDGPPARAESQVARAFL